MSDMSAGPGGPIPRSSFVAVDQRRLAGVVGMVALLLPTLMVVAAFSQLTPFESTCYRNSISHYYYAPFLGSIFIGALVFIGAYLMVYRGTKQIRLEPILSRFAGIFAICVALFPTSGHGCQGTGFRARAFLPFDLPEGATDPLPNATGPLESFFQLFDQPVWGFMVGSDMLHYGAAALLFAFLAWFALMVFTQVDPHQRLANGKPTQAKTIRNALYYLSGGTIILCMLAIGLAFVFDPPWWDANRLTFWFEAIALWAFGFSWLVKARFLGAMLQDPNQT